MADINTLTPSSACWTTNSLALFKGVKAEMFAFRDGVYFTMKHRNQLNHAKETLQQLISTIEEHFNKVAKGLLFDL
jgi:hypothetical protein